MLNNYSDLGMVRVRFLSRKAEKEIIWACALKLHIYG